MAKNKTQPTRQSVTEFIESVPQEQKRKDSYRLIEIMKEITGCEPVMWGPSIIGFGNYHYKYDSGHEGDFAVIGFSPRKAAISLYIYSTCGTAAHLLPKLGKFKMGKACIYVNKLSDIDEEVMREITVLSIKSTAEKYEVTLCR
jgi:hypothetical protein